MKLRTFFLCQKRTKHPKVPMQGPKMHYMNQYSVPVFPFLTTWCNSNCNSNSECALLDIMKQAAEFPEKLWSLWIRHTQEVDRIHTENQYGIILWLFLKLTFLIWISQQTFRYWRPLWMIKFIVFMKDESTAIMLDNFCKVLIFEK